MNNNQSRRTFIRNTAAATAVISIPSIIPAHAFGANDRINAAVLGVNGRGKSHISSLMAQENVAITHFCDPDMNVLKARQKDFKDKYSKDVALEQDLRKIYDNKDINVVSIATPNHWHSLAVIWACQAGKDCYVEKPGSHNIYEGRKMVEAAQKYDRIVQHGVQLRSSPSVREAVKMMHEGYIGRVYMSRGLVFRWRGDIGNKGFEPVPEGLDYDIWAGPAAKRPFSRNIVHYNWHWTFEYGNGDVGNQGIHETDLCMWGLNVGLPTKITSMGGKFVFNDAKETPEVLTSVYHYPEEDKVIQFEVRPWCTNTEEGVTIGKIFYGVKRNPGVYGYYKKQILYGKKSEKRKRGNSGGLDTIEKDSGAWDIVVV